MKKRYTTVEHKRQKVYYEHLFLRFLGSLLFCVLIVQPIAPIFAADESVVQEESQEITDDGGSEEQGDTEEVTSYNQDSEPTVQTSEEFVNNGILSSEESEDENIIGPVPPLEQEDEQNTVDDSTQTSNELIEGTSPASANATGTENEVRETPITEGTGGDTTNPLPIDSEYATNTEGELISTTTDGFEGDTLNNEQGEDTIVNTDVSSIVPDSTTDGDVFEENVSTTTATTTGEVVVQEIDPTMNAVDDNHYLFDKNSCVIMGDSAYYCTQTAVSAEIIGIDRVFSAPDADGDKEIFIERDSELTQVTSNAVDDDAPYYDEVSNSIVWHRLIDARFQIMSYSLDESEEVQITNDRYNNMEPTRFDDTTVWQGWVGNDWEVMILDGDSSTMLTDNTEPDIAPRISGDYIMWQSYSEGAWRVKVFDRATKQIETIADADGASIDNPRFVLVYDTKYDNGDIETKGYDLARGEVVPLSATPMPAPHDIPEPEQTGESRAFVQAPVSVKTKTSTSSDDTNFDDTVVDNPSDTTRTHELIITPYVEPMLDIIETDTDDQTLENPTTTIMSSFEVDESSDKIPDLIITPYVEAIEDTLDSQDSVAPST